MLLLLCLLLLTLGSVLLPRRAVLLLFLPLLCLLRLLCLLLLLLGSMLLPRRAVLLLFLPLLCLLRLLQVQRYLMRRGPLVTAGEGHVAPHLHLWPPHHQRHWLDEDAAIPIMLCLLRSLHHLLLLPLLLLRWRGGR